jgi:hypothetical protein
MLLVEGGAEDKEMVAAGRGEMKALPARFDNNSATDVSGEGLGIRGCRAEQVAASIS